LSGALPRQEHYFFQTYAEWDDTLWEKWRATRADEVEKIITARTAEYRDDFLRSPEWAEMRAKVMRRAAWVCESCLVSRASDVHHINYLHGRMPPAWHLRAVCRPCHDHLHGKSE
jgi:hypothetical protein